MTRILVLGVVAMAMLVVPLGMASKADAGDFKIVVKGPAYGPKYGGIGYPAYYPSPVYPPACVHYHVMYRHCSYDPWQLYGTYHSHYLAHQAEHQLEWQGFQAKVVPY